MVHGGLENRRRNGRTLGDARVVKEPFGGTLSAAGSEDTNPCAFLMCTAATSGQANKIGRLGKL